MGFDVIGQSSLALKYVLIPVSFEELGIQVSPAADPVQFAFMPTPTQKPQNSDWVSGSWDNYSAVDVIYPWRAKCLVGPGGAVTLGIGTYIIWLKITDNPEIPADIVGQLQIS
jgi:hypothetical protein